MDTFIKIILSICGLVFIVAVIKFFLIENEKTSSNNYNPFTPNTNTNYYEDGQSPANDIGGVGLDGDTNLDNRIIKKGLSAKFQ